MTLSTVKLAHNDNLAIFTRLSVTALILAADAFSLTECEYAQTDNLYHFASFEFQHDIQR